ncbi:uncharacterized protein LY79DRAFT_531098 [Colletotrichum navitas]|uniref:Uncharacterized protein n=1 Tax=Colletotrichum navitas TaxID=681940 RepID=A0AAD8UXQ7_9PEZI|nr:uncharacterized protein LY79DRAFT_531098 [Colletotrichum navitas]KAK1561604.1 hypothetical protein LY79DRAFT_531098 [Colletotrichum navitas]
MPSNKPDFVAPRVVAVREDEERLPKDTSPQFELRVRCSRQKLVLFSLVASFAHGASAKTTVYLQITADSLDSLDRTDYNEADVNTANPPCPENIHQQLGMRSVTRLQFRLRSGEAIQLVVPSDFTPEQIPDDMAQSAFEFAESLAAASRFSLYFQHNILKKESFFKYKAAIPPSTSLTDDLRKSYRGMRDVRRLYNGVGGKVHAPRGVCHASPPARERCSSPAAATASSCGSTLPFETIPRLQEESPPPYDECLSGKHSPGIRSDSPPSPSKSPGSDHAPPRYGDTEQRCNVLDASQDVLPSGGKDGATCTPTKRKRSFTAGCSTATTTKGAPRLDKIQRSLFVDAVVEKSDIAQILELQREQIELQRQQIQQLQKNVEELQRWNRELKMRQDELEEDCSRLEKRLDRTDDTIDNLSIDVTELEDKCDELGKQMPDVGDELKDWKENMGDAFKEDICQSIEESMAKQIAECVEAQADDMRRRVREALR